jgi:hypothetical protein
VLVLFLSCAGMSGCGLLRDRSPHPAPPIVALPPAPPVVEPPRRCPEHPSIAAWERRLRSRAHAVQTRGDLARGARHLPRLRRILARAGLSPRLALLPLLESRFVLRARGRRGERGLWQLRSVTARRFGLVVDAGHDERLNPVRATRAAARYLRHLHRRYRSWPLALAAYNAGEQRVDRALARRPRASFWQLADERRLPPTTRDYVPRFIALLRVVEGVPQCPSPLV